MNKTLFFILILLVCSEIGTAQESIARRWNEEVLNAIRRDFARPTVHARNLFHISVAMYDAWAAFEPNHDTYLLGKSIHGFSTNFSPLIVPTNTQAAQEEAISFAAYRLIKHRFQYAPFGNEILFDIDQMMLELNYDISNTSINYACGPAELGNFIAENIIDYGFQDGSNEEFGYANQFYKAVNPPLQIEGNGNPTIQDLNRWQPLSFTTFIDQAGNPIDDNVPAFLGPEWGSVLPFALNDSAVVNFQRDGFNYKVYNDPSPPPFINETGNIGLDDDYKWGFNLVSVWSGHLSSDDTTRWDISPKSIGNINVYPREREDYPSFYNFFEGGDNGKGHSINPRTNLPYEPQIVKRGDYARVLAEFWADGPDSETPPGHWFTILNTVNDDPLLVKKFAGVGDVLNDLEWDIKSYFILGGALHDAAICTWGIKGWYDYIRPVSAIRAMAARGQSSDSSLTSFHPEGVTLIDGHIELIKFDDPLAGANSQHIGKIKLRAWQGPEKVNRPATETAGVGWIRAENWYPYQRPTFVTPPFAGYISGHSTFSGAAADVLTKITGDAFFPGGLGEFTCSKNEFLVFEDGPSENILLQWATYKDAADQCSLSRIWGGIHPPADDIPGRIIGQKIGADAFKKAINYFNSPTVQYEIVSGRVFPNPTSCGVHLEMEYEGNMDIKIYTSKGQLMYSFSKEFIQNKAFIEIKNTNSGLYMIKGFDEKGNSVFNQKVIIY